MRHFGKGVGRLHRRHHVRKIHFGGQPRYVVERINAVDGVAQIAQPHALVDRMLGDEFRQHLPQRLVLVVIVLELLQLGHHRIPAAFGDADSKHDEKGVQAAFFDDDAMFGQILGDDGGRDTRAFGKVAIDVEPRRDDRRLDRIEHVETIGQLVAETVPAVAGLQHPGFTLLDTFLGQIVGPPDLEPPVVAPLFADLAHGAAEVECLGNRFLDQRRARRLLHHRRRHIA